MTHDKRNDLQTDLPDWEARINKLLDGELDENATAVLKREAGEDRQLARAIIEAYELQRGMDHLGIERAPASLRKKLRQIPRAEKPFLRIDKVGYRTGDYMQRVLGAELRRGVTDNLSRHFPYTEQSHEEEKS